MCWEYYFFILKYRIPPTSRTRGHDERNPWTEAHKWLRCHQNPQRPCGLGNSLVSSTSGLHWPKCLRLCVYSLCHSSLPHPSLSTSVWSISVLSISLPSTSVLSTSALFIIGNAVLLNALLHPSWPPSLPLCFCLPWQLTKTHSVCDLEHRIGILFSVELDNTKSNTLTFLKSRSLSLVSFVLSE